MLSQDAKNKAKFILDDHPPITKDWITLDCDELNI